MSNVIKPSNLIGPGFNKANFFQQAGEVNLSFKVNGHVVAYFKVIDMTYVSQLSGASVIYQNNLALLPVIVSSPQAVYSGVTRINITLS